MKWLSGEVGPKCTCGSSTEVVVVKTKPYLMCSGHVGLMFPLPAKKPVKWPDLNHREMFMIVGEGIEQEA